MGDTVVHRDYAGLFLKVPVRPHEPGFTTANSGWPTQEGGVGAAGKGTRKVLSGAQAVCMASMAQSRGAPS